MRREDESSNWEKSVTRAQLWIAAVAPCMAIIGGVGAFVLTTRETALRLEWRIQQAERILLEVQKAKDVQSLALEVRDTQNKLRSIEMQISRLQARSSALRGNR